MIYKTLHYKKLKNEQNEPHRISEMYSLSPEEYAVHVSLEKPVVLHLLQIQHQLIIYWITSNTNVHRQQFFLFIDEIGLLFPPLYCK